MTTDQQAHEALRALVREPVALREDGLDSVLAAVQRTPQARTRLPHIDGWWSQPLFGATRFAIAAAIVALFGGFLLVAQPFDRVSVTVPGAQTEGLPPVIGPAGNGLIAFSRDGDIFVGDPVSGTTTAIVSGPASDTEPTFSPDGTHIAFVRVAADWDRNDPPPPWEIHVVRPDGSDERAIEGANSLELTREGTWVGFGWTPDSAGIVVNHITGDRGSPGEAGRLTLFDLSGAAGPWLLTPPLPPQMTQCGYLCGDVGGLFRPPNGDRILYVFARPHPGGRDPGHLDPYVAVIDPDGTDREILANRTFMIENGFGDAEMADPSWSPDATRILVKLGFNGPPPESLWPAFLMDADGSDIRRVDGYGPWSPDGSRIAFEE
jgi:hypothetical protein